MGKASAKDSPSSPATLRALVVEDCPADAELVLSSLRRAGLRVEFDVVETQEGFAEHLKNADFDIILSDYNLGTWTASDALEILEKSGHDIPLIIVTGTLGDEAAVECIKQGAADYVLKERLPRLPVAIRRALEDKARRAQAALLNKQILRAKRDWERTFDSVPDPVFIIDGESRVQRANRAAATLVGLQPAQLIGQHCYEVFHHCSEPPSHCPHPRLLASGKEERGDFEEPWLKKWFDSTATPLRSPEGVLEGCVHVMRDVTEQRALEAQYRQAQKMEAMGRLAGGVAHDFNNLLTAITGYSELLLARLQEEDTLRRYVEEVKKAGDRAASLTRQLLTFSRQQVLEPRVLDLNSVVANVDKMLRRVIGEDIELVTILVPDLGPVKADPGQLEQVMLNLAVNSRDAMPQGGKLTIETANVELAEASSHRHGELSPGKYVVLAVSDSGCGMTEETQAHIFEPFFTTKDQGKGTGLGLAMVYGIVKQSGGSVWVYSEVGRGTTFKVYLPQVNEKVTAQVPRPPPPVLTRGWETILLVEDEEPVRSLVRSVLEAGGYVVLEARHGEDALVVAEMHKGPIQLLVTDVVMPEMSGPELAEHLAPFHREMKVLYMSGYTEDAIQHHGVLASRTAYLPKPFTPETLARKVREVLNALRVADR
jgi:hypothetical protein